MDRITQTMRFRQAAIEYSLKYGVTKAAVRYRLNRQYIYRWRKRYDGTLASLADRSHRPHHHPNQHTPEEIKLILNMRRRNPHTGIVVFWVKLRQRGYTRSISGLYRFLKKRGQMAEKLPIPKYKPVEDAKENGGYYYQYTFLDEYSRFRYLEAFKEHSTYSSTQFILHCIKRFPFAIECVQTDNGTEFTNRLNPQRSDKKTLFEKTLQKHHIRHQLIRPYTPRHNGKVERSHRKDNEEFYASHSFFSFEDFKKQLAVRERSYNHFPMRPLNWLSPIQVLSAFPPL